MSLKQRVLGMLLQVRVEVMIFKMRFWLIFMFSLKPSTGIWFKGKFLSPLKLFLK